MNKSKPTAIYNSRNHSIMLNMKELQKEYLELADMIEEIVAYLENQRLNHRNYVYAEITSKKVSDMLQIILDSIYDQNK